MTVDGGRMTSKKNNLFICHPSSVIRHLSAVLLVIFSLTPNGAYAVPLIRDAEIEYTLHSLANPIFKTAGLKPSAVNIFIVQDDALNAYVAGGSNLFIHTGLIEACDTPDMLLGVMAHETGHIAGGHLAQGTEKLKGAEMGTIFTYVLGAAAAVATRKPEAAAAVITGGQTTLQRNFLAFTRAHEEAADQAGLGFLDKLHISAGGLMKVFSLLQRHQREHANAPDPYLVTHPLTDTRIDHVRNHIEKSSIPKGQYPKLYDVPHARMIAKLYGFLETPERTLQKYPQSNKSVAARMARAIAYYKMPDIGRSLAEMNSLIAESPNDPFFHELKGQILFENGRTTEAMVSYAKAVQLLPDAPLILADLAKVELAQKTPNLASAIAHLEKANDLDNTNPGVWHLLGIAHGKAGNTGMSNLALAEEAALEGDFKTALAQVNQSLTSLKEGTPAWRRAQDLKAHAIEMQHQEEESKSSF